jgi:A/G-specific adenine glycosylase
VALNAGQIEEVQRRVLDWYAASGRDLPWRRTRDPYAILVSEVMLQQTQVDRVIPRWHAWLAQFPTLRALARATPADAIRAWQGLGYNLRAVRLHMIARQAVEQFGGELPRTVEALLSLKGIGQYTARAVAAFGFGQPVAVVDTNVRRVLQRIFGESAEPQTLADAVLPVAHAYPWNQALMDLGATICRAERPVCLLCPVRDVCSAAGSVVKVKRARTTPNVPFEQTSRYARGRILDALRTLPDGEGLAVQEADWGGSGTAVVDQLVRDGLVVRGADGLLRLPA